jgi:ATP-dependent DNA helicase DinG
MAEAVAAAIENGASIICEAGTGTGKTFAYLVPALLSGRRTVISTGTRHLQDQLFERDLPLVRQAVGQPVNVARLKGRDNYLCLHRLRRAEAEGGRRGGAALLHDVSQWAQRTDLGDLAEFGALPEESRLRGILTSTTDNCLGSRCEFYDDCFVFRARRRAAEADVVIVNHHLYLSALALREQGHGDLLPPPDVVVFDEAHQLPDLAARFFGRSLSSHQWLDLVHDAKSACLEEAADLPDLPQRLDSLEKRVRDLRLALGEADAVRGWRELLEEPPVAAAVEDLGAAAEEVGGILEGFAERGRLLDQCCRRIRDLGAGLQEFRAPSGSGLVQWLEIRGRGFVLHATPLDVSGLFREFVAAAAPCTIYTSATLSVGGSFDHFAGQLGLAGTEARSWPSPFDYRSQALLYVPEGLPDPRDPAHTGHAVAAARPVLELTGGRAFFLFTSYRALNAAAPLVRRALPFPVLVQGEAPRTELLETFRATQNAVLLGTGSFWEGVDVRGQALSCVIIDKLPFASPEDPVLKARLDRIAEEGGNAFRDHQLPEAVTALRQGIGRLIRDEGDCGVLMICDPRLLARSYGRVFLNSLPEMTVTQSMETVAAFLRRHGLPSLATAAP